MTDALQPPAAAQTKLSCNARDVPEAGSRGDAAAGVFVTRHGGVLRAWRDACPHYGDTPLAWRRHAYLNADGSRIVCAAHGAQFEPITGLCLLGPCLGQSLTALPLTCTQGGDLFVTAPVPSTPPTLSTLPTLPTPRTELHP